MSMPVTDCAPVCAVMIDRMPVPHPMSRTFLPEKSVFMSRMVSSMRAVVAWCPVPKLIFGSMMISCSMFSIVGWNPALTSIRSCTRIGVKFSSQILFQSWFSISVFSQVIVYSAWKNERISNDFTCSSSKFLLGM